MNYQKETERIVSFIRIYLAQAGLKDLVIGLSGGIDSSLSAALALMAVGPEHLHAVNLPHRLSNSESAADAALLASHLGISLQTIDISLPTDTYFENFAPDADRMRRGNWMARIRMNVLYDLSAKYKALVVGTSNRTELFVGYCTQYGDSACAFEPIGHLYKTEVWSMACALELPEKIITKIPTADLWEGQSDEAELGISYPLLDSILSFLTEPGCHERPEVDTKLIAKVEKMIARSEFKRLMPPVPERDKC